MSGLAFFSLMYRSLLDFDEYKEEEVVRYNLKTLYGIDEAPCNNQLRARLDNVEPNTLNRAF